MTEQKQISIAVKMLAPECTNGNQCVVHVFASTTLDLDEHIYDAIVLELSDKFPLSEFWEYKYWLTTHIDEIECLRLEQRQLAK